MSDTISILVGAAVAALLLWTAFGSRPDCPAGEVVMFSNYSGWHCLKGSR